MNIVTDYLDSGEAAAMLRCSRSNIYALAKRPNDPLPGKRIGGTLLFKRSEVAAWIDRQPGIVSDDPQQPAQTEFPDNVIPMRGQYVHQISTHHALAHSPDEAETGIAV